MCCARSCATFRRTWSTWACSTTEIFCLPTIGWRTSPVRRARSGTSPSGTPGSKSELHGHHRVLFTGAIFVLVGKHLEGSDEANTGISGPNHSVRELLGQRVERA